MNKISRQSGVSLIEVLVVLVLLLIGIFSVIRLFPPGFLINKQVAEQTAAVNLAKQEMNRYTNASINLMDAIVPVIPTPVGGSYVFVVDTGATPDDLTEADPNVYGNFAYYVSNVNKIRRIIGESVRIPVPSTTTLGQRGSIYMLGAGPFMDVNWQQNGQPTATSSLYIAGAPLNRRLFRLDDSGNRPNPSDFLGNSSYSIDYQAKEIAFLPFTSPTNTPREYLLSISYYNGANIVNVVDIVITQPSGNAGDVWLPIPLPAGAGELVAYSDTCSRKFTALTPGNPWSTNDPYEFYLDPVNSPRVGTLGQVGANMGVVVFNPMGHDFTENSAFGPMPLTARIDYDVLDWHIIHEDRPMPASSPYQVSMALKGLKQVGDFEDDQTAYTDIFHGVARSGSGFFGAGTEGDFLVYNVATGDYVPSTNYTVNYKDGTVTFTDVFGQNNASGTFRFFYRAHGDWALQIQKAAGTYRETGAPQPSYNEYFIGDGNNGTSLTRIYFPASEAGKTISLREFWYNDGTNNLRVGNESYHLNADRTQFLNIAGRLLTWLDIHDKHTDATRLDKTSAGYAVLGVQGLSFRTRVLWRNGSQVTETANGNVVRSRWRKSELESILTRSPN